MEKRRAYRLEQARRQRIADRRARAEQATANANATANPDHATNDDPDQANNQEQNACVVCLTNPREVVLLDCGHVCLCLDCLEQMPSETCPICRVNYRTYAPCYIP